MKATVAAPLLVAALASSATAGPFRLRHTHASTHAKREVPQEHSHEFCLNLTRVALRLNNPNEIADPVFGLLGNAAAMAGLGKLTDPDCLQMETADQAFTNAKAAADIPLMAGSLLYRAIERNTGGVGVASVICAKAPVNPEIAALSQHQDPASNNAAAVNKGIAIELAKRLAAIGSDPLLALESGTFAPGDRADATGKGNSCDTVPDDAGCIFTENRLVLDATPEEIAAAVAGVPQTFTGTGVLSATHIDFAGLPVATGTAAVDAGAGAGAGAGQKNTNTGAGAGKNNGNGQQNGKQNNKKNNGKGKGKGKNKNNGKGNNNGGSAAGPGSEACAAATAAPARSQSCSVITTTVPASVAATLTAGNGAARPTATAGAGAGAGGDAATGTNLQAFTGTLGGPAPPVISGTGNRPFSVNGNTFVNAGAALSRSCDIQKNACANAANSGKLAGGVGQCETQRAGCGAANPAIARRWALARRQATGGSFGSCSDPTIVFSSNNADRQNESAFVANNQADFAHGSALKIGVISDFVCQRLNDQCKAPAQVVAACNAASTAAKAAQQGQAAADVFNAFAAGGAGAGNNKAGKGNGNANAGAGAGAAQPTSTAAKPAATAPAATTGAASQGSGCAVQEQMVVVTLTQCA